MAGVDKNRAVEMHGNPFFTSHKRFKSDRGVTKGSRCYLAKVSGLPERLYDQRFVDPCTFLNISLLT